VASSADSSLPSGASKSEWVLLKAAIVKPVLEVADGACKRCGQTRELVRFAPPEIRICPLWGRIPAGFLFGAVQRVLGA
jgi:hypothetical protein